MKDNLVGSYITALQDYLQKDKKGDKMVGIYKITNNINGKTYVGQSNNIERRFAQHKSPNEQERAQSKPLYKAFKKYGIEHFSFEVIEECSIEELDNREIYWIKELNSLVSQNGYNISEGDGGASGENHPKHKLTKDDVIDIRTRYNNRERCKEVEKLYSDRIGHSGFSKIWKGETWKDVMPEVYTVENKEFHKHNTAQIGSENGRALLNEEDVIAIRLRKKNGEHWRAVYEDYKFTGIKDKCFQQTWLGYNWKSVVV